MVFNTYQYKERNFQNFQASRIEKAYGTYVMNEKLFPGGNNLFVAYLEPNLPDLKQLKLSGSAQYETKRDSVLQAFFAKMREQQPMDSIIQQIIRKNNLDSRLVYKLRFEQIELYVEHSNEYYPLYLNGQSAVNGEIAGTLSFCNPNNKVLHLSVTAGSTTIYRFTYSLFVDYPNRLLRIWIDMLPVFIFSLLCIGLTIMINYLTYRNWVDQRKESELKTEFLNHIRHEFNTPITTILVCAQSLKDERKLLNEEDIGSMGAVIERQSLRLSRYVQQVMDAVRLEDQVLEKTNVAISVVTAMLLKDLSIRYLGLIKVQYTALENDEQVWLDESVYFTILDNLISNAHKFNTSGDPAVHFYWERNATGIALCVQDNGVGIAPQELDAIFGKFYRSKSNAPNLGKGLGLGLGLYYVKASLDLMKWQIEVFSDLNKGTRFVLKIPITIKG